LSTTFSKYLVRATHAINSVNEFVLTYPWHVNPDALEIAHGPGHAEVKFANGEPCLIEIGARCHGREGTDMPILNRCQGYNQVGASLDAYFDEKAFDALPTLVCLP